jgi:NAD(P)-dependent dehydrogenase (short-subunit alcohol dehydrogenase family)
VITGAASGIGLAIAEALVTEGMRVVMSDLNEATLHDEVRRMTDSGADVYAVAADVSDPLSVEEIAVATVDRYGQLNVAVNNAGIVRGGTSWEISLDDWQKVIGINLWGVIHGVRAFVPRILASGAEGHVVNTASMAAVIARPNLGPYTVSKHGVLGLSDVLRAELVAAGAPIGVSVVMPGMIKTGMNPIGTVSAASVAANVVDAIRRNRPYVFTDSHSADDVERRLSAIIAARQDVIDSDHADSSGDR